MSQTLSFSLHILWILLALLNFVIQLRYYFHDQSRRLYMGKKITTPLLLFSALAIIMLETGGFPAVPGLILLAMGIGELGIEGSQVVESREPERKPNRFQALTVLIAGILFLLVNVFLGVLLLREISEIRVLLFCGAAAAVIIAVLTAAAVKIFRPLPEIRTQMIIYAAGLAVLLAGVLSDLPSGLTPLGTAAAVLTLSDSLVLLRMGAGFRKDNPRGFRILLVLLVVILLLYYLYMAVLISMKSPFIV